MLLDMYELANGLGAPPLTYPLFEHALRGRWGHSRDEHMQAMSALWAGFARAARTNPHSQFEQDFDADFLATPSKSNYPISDPYLKWHVAQDAVNQGAAVVMTTTGEAQRLGISADKWVYLHGSAEAKDRLVSKRSDLSRSAVIEASLSVALDRAGLRSDEIAHLDLYSCFPCAVFLAAEALGYDWRSRELTVTGGLPFFGGAGNNYSMHAVVSIVEKLRVGREDFGLVLANGGFLSKEAVGIYSTRITDYVPPKVDEDAQRQVDARPVMKRLKQDCVGVIKSYTIGYRKGEMQRASIVVDVDGDLCLAATPRDDRAGDLLSQLGPNGPDPLGRSAVINSDGQNNVLVALKD